MKTIGRILIIIAVTSLIAAGLYFAVNATASNVAPGGFDREGQLPAGGALQQFDGSRPAFPEGSRPEGGFRPEGRDRGFGGGWIFGAIKNVVVIAFFVLVIVLPSSLRKKKRVAAQTNGSAPNPSN